MANGNQTQQNSQLPLYTVVGTIVNNKGDVLKYILLDDRTAKLNQITPVQAVNAIGQVAYTNADVSPQYQVLVGKGGTILNQLPQFNVQGKCIKNKGIILYRVLLDADNSGKVYGYWFYISNANTNFGNIYKGEYSDLKKCEDMGMKPMNYQEKINREMFDLKGNPFPTLTMKNPRRHVVINSATGTNMDKVTQEELEEVDEYEDLDELQEIPVASLNFPKTGNLQWQDVQKKWFEAKQNLKKVSPYYYLVLNSIKEVPAKGFGTLGVTEDTMYWDIDFVGTLEVSELTYILIHEMMHIVMNHSNRFNPDRMNHVLWNIATDLYINTVISESYVEKVSGKPDKKPYFGEEMVRVNGGVIQCPPDGIHLETIGGNGILDIAKDTPESIYKKLVKENPNGAQIMGDPEQSTILSTDKNAQAQQQQQSVMQTAILDLGQRVMEDMTVIYDECNKIAQTIDARTQRLQDIDSKIEKASIDKALIARLEKQKEDLQNNISQLDDIRDKIDSHQMTLAEIAGKLMTGTIRKDTAEKIVDSLSNIGMSLQNKGALLKSNELKEVGTDLRNISSELDRLANQVPDTVDMAQQGQQQGGQGQPIGIVPNNIENAPANNGQGNQDNQSGSGQGQDQDQQNQQGDGQGQQGQSDSGQGQQGGQQSNQQGSQQAGSGGGNSMRQGSGQDEDGDGKYGNHQVGSQSDSHVDMSQSQSSQMPNNSSQSSPFGEGTDNTVDKLAGEGKTRKVQTKEVSVIFNGQKLSGKVNMDVMTNNKKRTETTVKNNREANKTICQKIKAKIDIQKAKGKEVSTVGGAEGLGQRAVEFGLSTDISWKDIFKKRYKFSKSFRENKHRENLRNKMKGIEGTGKYMLRRKRVVKDVVVAIDVSGSVSEEEIKRYLSEVANLIKTYSNETQDVNGELLFWSTNVGDAGEFNTIKDMCKVKPLTTGGTDVRPVFQYLNGEIATQTGKKEPKQTRDMMMIMILTDGYFSENYADYKKIFGSKVVWIIDGDASRFDPPFGDVVSLNTR